MTGSYQCKSNFLKIRKSTPREAGSPAILRGCVNSSNPIEHWTERWKARSPRHGDNYIIDDSPGEHVISDHKPRDMCSPRNKTWWADDPVVRSRVEIRMFPASKTPNSDSNLWMLQSHVHSSLLICSSHSALSHAYYDLSRLRELQFWKWCWYKMLPSSSTLLRPKMYYCIVFARPIAWIPGRSHPTSQDQKRSTFDGKEYRSCCSL